MIAFTILGLLVFWYWCFLAGYLLGHAANILGVLLALFRLERKVQRDIEAFAFMQRGAK